MSNDWFKLNVITLLVIIPSVEKCIIIRTQQAEGLRLNSRKTVLLMFIDRKSIDS